MTTKELYRHLVDMYAGEELPQELEDALEDAAVVDPTLMVEMIGLRRLIEKLHNADETMYTEETRQRILAKLCLLGIDVEPNLEEPTHYQYALPING